MDFLIAGMPHCGTSSMYFGLLDGRNVFWMYFGWKEWTFVIIIHIHGDYILDMVIIINYNHHLSLYIEFDLVDYIDGDFLNNYNSTKKSTLVMVFFL